MGFFGGFVILKLTSFWVKNVISIRGVIKERVLVVYCVDLFFKGWRLSVFVSFDGLGGLIGEVKGFWGVLVYIVVLFFSSCLGF